MAAFKDKVAAITGAGSGIGRALAVELASRGCNLALSDVNEAGLAETAALLKGVKVTTARVDVSKKEQIYAWAGDVVRDHGRVNLIFNNAGVALGSTVEGTTDEDFEWLMSINFWGVVHGTRAFLPHLRASGDGHVVNVSSLFGILSIPGQSAYNAAKFGVRGFTESLAQELRAMNAPVYATSVHPGGIKTNIARAARTHASLGHLGVELSSAGAQFEKLFITTPTKAARTILSAVERRKARVLVGPDAHLLDLMVRVFPQGYQWVTSSIAARNVRKQMRRAEEAARVAS